YAPATPDLSTLSLHDALPIYRLLAPYLKEAGLEPKAPSFSNWIGLDGHVGGHYLTALAIHYAATGDVRCKERMEYMLTELKRCRSEEHTSELQSRENLVCRLL